MKNIFTLNSLIMGILIPVLFVFLLCSCNKWMVPPEYVGEWKTKKSNITVRTEPQVMKFKFTSDSALVSVKINSDKTVSGIIGSAEFVNGKLKKNWGLPPSVTGVSYIVECGSVGKLFPNDPVTGKEVELWLSPLKGNDVMEAELRLTQHKAVFPMAGMLFTKVH